MADSEANYIKVSSDGVDSERSSSSRALKVGLALIGGSCLVLLSIVAISTYAPELHSASMAESTSLVGMPTSLRSMNVKTLPNGMKYVPVDLRTIPGPSPWKEMALAGIEATNRCDRDVSAQANAANKIRDIVARADASIQKDVTSVGQSIVKSVKELEAGRTGPMGLFDPLGFSAKVNGEKLFYYREAELKHGRICMLAFFGYFLQEVYGPVLPGPQTDQVGFHAFTETSLFGFWGALAVACAIPEFVYSVPTLKGFGEMKQGRVPGDFGWDPLDLKEGFDFLDMQNKELNNGRLAMLGIAGMIAQEVATGRTELDLISPAYNPGR